MSHSNPEFKIVIPIEKSQDKARLIGGVASGLGVDGQKQKMAQSAIQSVARQAASGNIPFKDHHAKLDSILSNEIGRVVNAQVAEDFTLQVEVELEPEGEHPTADYLYKSVEKGKQYGMSVGGTISKFHVEMESGEPIVVIDDMVLDEISVTTRPAFTNSLGTVVRKAIDAAESESSGDKMDPVVEEKTTEPVQSPVVDETTPEVVETASAPETPVVEDSPVVEKSISADTARENQKLKKAVSLFAQGNAILAELGLTDLASPTPDKPVEVEKSQPAADDTSELTVLKSMLEAQAESHKQELEVLKSMIPSTPIPGVTTRRDEVEEMKETIAKMAPEERIRFGLRLLHDGDKI